MLAHSTSEHTIHSAMPAIYVPFLTVGPVSFDANYLMIFYRIWQVSVYLCPENMVQNGETTN